MDTTNVTAEDKEEKSNENGKTGTIIREAMEKLLEFQEKVDNGRKDILNTILDGISGLEGTYDKRLKDLKKSIEEDYDKRLIDLKTSIIEELKKKKEEGGVFDFITSKEDSEKIRDPAEIAKSKIKLEEVMKKPEEFKRKIDKIEEIAGVNLSDISPDTLEEIKKAPLEKMKMLDDMGIDISDADLNRYWLMLSVASMLPEKDKEIPEEILLFSLDSILEDDSKKLKRSLKVDFDIDWAENAEINKSINDETISISKDGKSAEIIVDENKEKATLKISDGKTYNLKVKTENNKINIYEDAIQFFRRKFSKYGFIYILKKRIDELKIQLLYNEGIKLLKRGDFKSACECFDEIIGMDPSLKGAWLNRGFALGKLDKIDEEIKSYEKAKGLDSNYKKALHNMDIAKRKQTKIMNSQR
jgi:tetratricopeptide (TPR) repeat protein